MVCNDSVLITPSITFEDRLGKWRRRKAGNSAFYEQSIVFPTASWFDVHLDLPNACQVNDIQIVFGSLTDSRDFSVNLYMSPSDSDYQIIRKETSHTADDYRICQLKEKWPVAARLDILFTNYTAGQGCTIFVQADDI